MKRKQRTLKIDPEATGEVAHVTLLDNPNEVRIAGAVDTFIAVKEEGITLSPGKSGKINIQAMPGNLRYGGLLTDTSFPLSLIPSTAVTPIPSQKMAIPFKDFVGDLKQMASIVAMFLGT